MAMTCCEIIFEDDFLIAVNKPEDVLSHPNPGKGSGAGKQATQSAAFEGPYDYSHRRFDTPDRPVWLIHRIDQDTSGILLAAKTEETAKSLRTMFDQHAIRKSYIALVGNRPLPPKGKWNDHLKEEKHPDYVRAKINPLAKPNVELLYATKQNFPKCKLALLEFYLLTGRTHQIRVQSAFHENPVAGDRVYGDFVLNKKLKERIGLRRLFLHASELSFQHPQTKKNIMIQSALPEELEKVLRRAY
ncbi:MAG: hypothetical protein A3G33_10380 [Omnitrophica bacterium RIFCSPLOWO2_12_FULL_44_17]|uniref:Pseudouridine synthase RsuA/RluA-like domain-containing protein n=1 Tax=Candidatus Danuiimicrobium aquiferis TaxID=1801832 RepID=A0A1G1L130_9BACT|nr:MAG: hypothetical protein A3B72_01655 [Omnitrophica bacterium RIFCSPHIGHO2_02_FULL_45_28]OGW90460.1 MAG: hypothetical protein A3E74_03590 [Omnitrophica bacterium RIFCSPHIGHO2_12_FULL_44_12]OGW98845.1 MAG: hypothetical protein A3G33_10380 [Omnitrophica bacterium RIFCSPLOWO2_12_FULL_44_17]